ncbi:MAG: hypothetical protein V3575_02015 [Candidatus Absconditabacteria bacterium]
MRYYIAYKFLGNDKESLKNNLEFISDEINKTGNETFIFFRDVQSRGDIKIDINEIMQKAYGEIDKSQGLFIFIDNVEKSEGLLLEAGYGKAKGKKIILAIKKEIDLRLLRSIADKIIEFDSIDELPEKIIKELS